MTKRKTKRQQAWSELVRLVTKPPKRYKHQRDGNVAVEVNRLRNQTGDKS